jgi:hypothetical protein
MIFKIKHLRTSLYFSKSHPIKARTPFYERKMTNLSKKGKVYENLTLKQAVAYYKQYYDENGKWCILNETDIILEQQ